MKGLIPAAGMGTRLKPISLAIPKELLMVGDKAVIEQSINMMKDFDSTVREIIQGGAGNKRILEVAIKEGSLIIDGVNDEILFEMDSEYVYSEPGEEISEGNLLIKTEKKGSINVVTIKRSYIDDNFDITYNLKDELKTLTKAGTSYKISIKNEGKKGDTPETEKWNIDIELV